MKTGDYLYCHTDFGYDNLSFKAGNFYKIKVHEVVNPEYDNIFVQFKLIRGGAWLNDVSVKKWFYTKSELRKLKIENLYKK